MWDEKESLRAEVFSFVIILMIILVVLCNIIPLFVQLEVWAKEREVAGLRASLNTLMSEIQRLNKLCAERKEAEDSLRKKWKKIEEFDSRRSELETIYSSLLRANMVRYFSFSRSCKLIISFMVPLPCIFCDVLENEYFDL